MIFGKNIKVMILMYEKEKKYILNQQFNILLDFRYFRKMILKMRKFVFQENKSMNIKFNKRSDYNPVKTNNKIKQISKNHYPNFAFHINNHSKSLMISNSINKQLRIQTNNSLDKTFKQYAKTISESIHKLNLFTDNLEGKVNTLLKAQQTQFVISYKSHMSKIKAQLSEMDQKLIQYQQKIQFYENQGRLSLYIKKVNFMELQQIKLFEQISFKDKKIKELQSEVEMLKKMQKTSNEQIKNMFRKKIQEQEESTQKENQMNLQKQISQSSINKNLIIDKHMSSIETFTTQIPSYHYRKGKINQSHSKERKLANMITESEQRSLLYQSHQYSGDTLDEQDNVNKLNLKSHKISVLEKQIVQLKAQNKKLLLYNSKYANSLSQLGEFFLQSVEELKRSISQKRKVKSEIKYQDFCKQDKLVLIATLLSNDSALSILYDSIFKPSPNKKRAHSVLQRAYGPQVYQAAKSHRNIQEIMANPQHNSSMSNKLAFPSIRKNKRILF